MTNFQGEASNTYVTGQSVSKNAIIAIWELVNDLQANAGKIYATRQDAVDTGQANIPPAYNRIVTIEANNLVVRGPGQTGDQLFASYPNWGTLFTIQSGDWQTLVGDLDTGLTQLGRSSGKIFGNRDSAADYGQVNLPSTLGVILVRNGDYLELRAPGWDTDPLFQTAPQWGVFDKVPLAGLVTTSFNNSGVTRLINVGGTGDAITADLPDDLSTAVFTRDKWFAFTALEDNLADFPTITVAGQLRTLRDVDGGNLLAGAIRKDRTYIFRTFGFQLAYLINASFSRSEIEAPAAAVRDSLQPNIGKIYETRQAAVDDGQEGIPAAYARIITMEADGVIAIRGPNTPDDPLFTGFPNWGVVQRLDVPAIAKRVEDIEVGDDVADGGTNIINIEEAGTLIRAYHDGLDFRVSQRLKNRLPSGGGGETADGWATTDDRFTAQAGQHGVAAIDRFIDRADGVRVPTVLVNNVTRKAIIISLYGQSNADVTRLSDPLFWDTPPFPYNAFMLDDMNTGPNMRGGMVGWQGVAVQRGTRFINASEVARGIQSYGSAALARLLTWDDGLRRVGMVRSSAWGGNKLIGDSPGAGIWKDSDGAYTQAWANWSGDIQQSYDLLTAQGYEVVAIYICFTHQEADWQTPAATYISQFDSMKSERSSIIATDFPGVALHWFVDQASGSGLRTPTYNGGAWPVREAIADIAAGDPDITMVMPRYWMPYGVTVGGAQEDIHHSYRARVWQGEVYAAAIREFEAGRTWYCPRMTAAAVSGNDVVVDFESLEPLVIDPTFCKVRPDMGFTVNAGAIGVTDVRLTGQRQVTVTCDAPPTGTIAYAYRSSDAQDVLDQWPLSTGAVRDAWTMPSLFDPGKVLPRAALGGILNL